MLANRRDLRRLWGPWRKDLPSWEKSIKANVHFLHWMWYLHSVWYQNCCSHVWPWPDIVDMLRTVEWKDGKHRGSKKSLTNWTLYFSVFPATPGNKCPYYFSSPYLSLLLLSTRIPTNKAVVVLKHGPQITWHFCYWKISSMSLPIESEWVVTASMIRVWGRDAVWLKRFVRPKDNIFCLAQWNTRTWNLEPPGKMSEHAKTAMMSASQTLGRAMYWCSRCQSQYLIFFQPGCQTCMNKSWHGSSPNHPFTPNIWVFPTEATDIRKQSQVTPMLCSNVWAIKSMSITKNLLLNSGVIYYARMATGIIHLHLTLHLS